MNSSSLEISYIHLETIDSTNNWVKRGVSCLSQAHLTCVVAEEQTAGRGRYSRPWFSPKGQNLYTSFFFPLPAPPYLGNLGQILALSCVTALGSWKVGIKWPNDLVVEGKKLGGILTEVVSYDQGQGVILGLGLNVNMPSSLLEQIDQPATSLLQISGQKWSLKDLLILIAEQFAQDLGIWRQKGFSPFVSLYNQKLVNQGKEICYLFQGQEIKGISQGINEQGKLGLQIESGKLLWVDTGEINLQ